MKVVVVVVEGDGLLLFGETLLVISKSSADVLSSFRFRLLLGPALFPLLSSLLLWL